VLCREECPVGHRRDAHSAKARKTHPDLDRRHLGASPPARAAPRRLARLARHSRTGSAGRRAAARGAARSRLPHLPPQRLGRARCRRAAGEARKLRRGRRRARSRRTVGPRACRLARFGRTNCPRRRGDAVVKLATTIKFSPGYAGIEMDLVWEAERLGFDAVWAGEAYGSDAVSPGAWVLARPSRIKAGPSVMPV